MRSLAVAFAFTSLLVACAEAPTDPETTSGVAGEEDDDKMHDGVDDGLELTPIPSFSTASCDAALLEFDANVRYGGVNGESVPYANLQCRWTFDDGGVSNDCYGRYEFAEGGVHDYTLEVRDIVTGKQAVITSALFVYPPLLADTVIEAPACGLSFNVKTDVNTGAFIHTSISPMENVVGEAFFLGAEGSFEVRVGGTYEIEVEVEDERAVGLICLKEIKKPVTLAACPDEHEHEPGCGH